MRRVVSVLALALGAVVLMCFSSCQQKKAAEHGTQLIVKVIGFHPKGMEVMKVENQHYDRLTSLAKASSSDGTTYTWSDSTLALDLYALQFDTQETIMNPVVYVFLGDGPVEITVTRSPYGVLTTQSKGSALQARYEQYTQGLRQVTHREKIDSAEFAFMNLRAQNDTVGMARVKEASMHLYDDEEVLTARYNDSVARSEKPDFFSFYLYYANQFENMPFVSLTDVELVEKALQRWQGDSVVQSSPLMARVRATIEAARPSLEGSPAPEFTAISDKGDTVGLSSLRGRIVLIDFWASYCGWCRQETPTLKAAYEAYHARKGVEFVSLSTDVTPEPWLAAVEQEGLPWPQWRPLDGQLDQVLRSYNITGIPLILLIDAQGTIVHRGLRGDEVSVALMQLPDVQ